MTFLQAVFPGYSFQLLPAKEVPLKGRYATMQALGMKLLPTEELVTGLMRVAERSYPLNTAVINAGDGVLADLIDVRAYDRYKEVTERTSSRTPEGRVPPAYGKNVIKVDILEEAVKDNNKILIGLFVPSRNEPTQDVYSAPDEKYMMERIWMYIHIGEEMISSFKVELLKEFKHYRVTGTELITSSPKINAVIDVFINDKHAPTNHFDGLSALEIMHKLLFY